MNILILHRIPYHYINYADSLDHERNTVVYIGTLQALSNIPEDIESIKIARKGNKQTFIEVIEIIEALGLEFDLVISLSEYELMDAAQVRSKFSIWGPLPEQVEKVRNKITMKNLVADTGVLVPRNTSLEAFMHSPDNVNSWSKELIFKPVDGASSENVMHFSDVEQLSTFLNDDGFAIKGNGIDSLDLSKYEIEEYINGDVLHFDGVCVAGELSVMTCCKYINSCLEYANGSPVASVQIDIDAETTQWVKTVLPAVELNNGVFHLEAIQQGSKLYFLEVANRSGGGMVIEAFQRQTGLHLPSLELAFHLNKEVELDIQLDTEHKYAFFMFPGHKIQSEYSCVEGHNFLSTMDEVIRVDILDENRPVKKMVTYEAKDVPFAGLLKSTSSDVLEKIVARVFSEVSVKAR